MPKPVDNYTHITKIPRNADLYVISGQIGVDASGELPKNMNLQITNAFINRQKALTAEQLTADNIIKVNIWATEKMDWNFMDSEWTKLFKEDYPAMTVGYLTELGWPEIKIEVEIWAANV